MTLNQIFTGLKVLGYDRYRVDGDLYGTKITCNLFKPGEVEPSVRAQSSTVKHSLECALKLAWKKS